MNFILDGAKRSSNICYYFVFTDFHSINFRSPNVGLFFMNIHGYAINSKFFVNLSIPKKSYESRGSPANIFNEKYLDL